MFFFFSSRRRHTRCSRDWSSDVCSSDLVDWRLDGCAGAALLEEFLTRLDQPSIDGFNTFCVAKHAHNNGAKVVLSGLGGDELFGGYSSFRKAPHMTRRSARLGLARPLRQ